MFKYKLSYFFRKKTKLEKHIIYKNVYEDIDRTGIGTIIIFMIWSFIFSLFGSLLFFTPIAYNTITSSYALTELSSYSITVFGKLSFILASIAVMTALLLGMFFLFEKINPINFFKYLLTFSSRKYTKKTFSKDMKRLLPLLQKIGFSNEDSDNLVHDSIFKESSYRRKFYTELFFSRLKEFYMRDKYKRSIENEENLNISNIINNFYLKKEIKNPALVQTSNQEQEVIFFLNKKKEA